MNINDDKTRIKSSKLARRIIRAIVGITDETMEAAIERIVTAELEKLSPELAAKITQEGAK